MTNTELRSNPIQPRAQKRLDSILAAARIHYKEVGRDRFNTADVATISECSIGTVYRYFVDRVAILDEIEPDRDKATKTLNAIKVVFEMDNSPAEEKLALIEGHLTGK